MTCILAAIYDNHVYIGGERSASDRSSILPMSRPKVGRVGEWIYGWSDNFEHSPNIANALTYIVDYKDPYEALKEFNFKKMHGVVGTIYEDQAMLFEIDDNSIIPVYLTGLGSGSFYALGAYKALIGIGNIYIPGELAGVDQIIYDSISIAIDLSPSCLGPIDIVHI